MTEMHHKKEYDYWLCSIPGVGNRSILKLLELCGSAREIYQASEEKLARVLRTAQLEELKKLRDQWNLQKEWERMEKQGIHFLTVSEAAYPGRLKEIPDPPYGIFFRGRLPVEEQPAAAIIGARDCSEYGGYVARELGAFLGRSQVQVISGMARGIDGISQQAVLDAGGSTTAVLGSGVDVCYPAQNRRLYERILEQGCILSFYPPGTPPRPQNFPPRNRIVSGLADVVVVVEARDKSGTLITVDMALEQGREVYVVPGRITDRLSDGCNRLIKQGAGVLLSPGDFLEELKSLWAAKRERQGAAGKGGVPQEALQQETAQQGEAQQKRIPGDLQEGLQSELPKDLQKLLKLLDFTPKSVETLLEALPGNWKVARVNAGLMRLCLLGLARQETPGYFYKKG